MPVILKVVFPPCPRLLVLKFSVVLQPRAARGSLPTSDSNLPQYPSNLPPMLGHGPGLGFLTHTFHFFQVCSSGKQQLSVETEQDPMALTSPPTPYPLPTFCLWKNFCQTISLIREVRRCKHRKTIKVDQITII